MINNYNYNMNYIDNKYFQQLLVEFLKQNKPLNELPEELIDMFYKIINNLLNKKEFLFYSYDIKEEMKQHAIYIILKYMRNYNYKKYSNPFSYFTQIVYNAFVQVINKENIEREKKFLIQGLTNPLYDKEE